MAKNAMTEAHEAAAGGELLLDPAVDVAARLDLVEHIEREPRRAAVQRAAKRAIAAQRRSGERGARRNDDARGEGGIAEAVVDDGRQISIERRGALRRDRRARDHVQQIGGGGERRIWRDRRLAGMAAQEDRDRHRQGRENGRRLGIVQQCGKRNAQTFGQRPARCAVEPFAAPRESCGARVGKRLMHPGTGEAAAGKALPHHRHRAFITVLGGEAFDGVTAYPDRAALAVGMAQYRFGRDHAFQSAVHVCRPRMSSVIPPVLPPVLAPVLAPRSAKSRATAARNKSMPAPVRAEVAIRSGNAAGRFRIATLTASVRSASAASSIWSHLVNTISWLTAALLKVSRMASSGGLRPWRASART